MMLEFKNYKQLKFSDLPDVGLLKDVSEVGMDTLVVVSEDMMQCYFDSRHQIRERAKALDAELVKEFFPAPTTKDQVHFFVFSSKRNYADSKKSRVVNL